CGAGCSGGTVLVRGGGQNGGLETDRGDVGDPGEAQPVAEEAGVEVVAEGERRAGGIDAAGVDDGGLLPGDQARVAVGGGEAEHPAGLGDDVDPVLEHVGDPGVP